MSINRRDLLKGAAILSGAAVLSGLAGCDNTKAPSGGDGSSNRKWDEEYDIVVVGAGGAGLVAAINAAVQDGDATIAVLEKTSSIGGSTGLSQGNIGANSTDLLLDTYAKGNDFMGNDTVQMYYEDKLASGMYLSDPDVARVFCENSLENYNWLKSLGITWSANYRYEGAVYPSSDPLNATILGSSQYLQRFTNGVYQGINRKSRYNYGPKYKDKTGGIGNIQCLLDTLEKYPNAQIITETAMKSIIRENQTSGEVLGLMVSSGSSEKAIRAKRAVILACGGYAGNADMLNLHDPRVHVTTQTSGYTGNTGDGIIAAQFIGAQALNMHAIQIDHGGTAVSAADSLAGGPETNPFTNYNPAVYLDLNREGKRFWSELTNRSEQYMEAKMTCLHANGIKTWWKFGDSKSVASKNLTADQWATYKRVYGKECNTLEEVASVIGCNVATLKETINRYNTFVDNKKDTDFGKETIYLTQKFDTPPYYVMEVTYYCRTTPGGLRINKNAEIIDFNGKPIPRLFGAGEVTGNTHGRFRNCGGDAWTDLVCFGRIAGTNAAKLTSAQ